MKHWQLEAALAWHYGLGQAYRASLRERPKRPPGQGTAFTYGETPARTAERLLNLSALGSGDRFLELGAGIGRVTLRAALRGADATGVEQLPSFVRNANRIAARLGLADCCRFIQGDLFEADWSQATVLFATPTTFSEADLERLEACYDTLQPGARLITLTQAPRHPDLTQLAMEVLDFSWGPATVFIHQREPPEETTKPLHEDQQRRLHIGPSPTDRPGGLGLMQVEIRGVSIDQVRAALLAALAAPDHGGLVFDADWAIWSLEAEQPSIACLTLEVFGFPVSGFSSLRRFLSDLGATSVQQRSR